MMPDEVESLENAQDQDFYNRIAGNLVHGQRALIDEGLDQNPDEAANAMQLEAVTGTPAPAIMTDPDEFKQNQRRDTAMQLVLNKPQLLTYLQSHPIAPAVSSDDWGNLDKYTRESTTLLAMNQLLRPLIGAAVEAESVSAEAQAGYGSAISPDQFGEVEQKSGRLGAASVAAVMQILGVPQQLFGAAVGAGSQLLTDLPGFGAIEKALYQGDPRNAKADLEQTVGAAAMDVGVSHGAEPEEGAQPPTILGTAAAKLMQAIRKPDPVTEAIQAAKPWTDAGQEPPAGVHPLIDQAKAQVNAQIVDLMEESLKNAEASLTRERSPELFQLLNTQMHKDTSFSIHSDAALALYGDKPPAPDDGLLGWVPNIESQLKAANEIGADIHVPYKDWMANVQPEVAKALHDDIRAWPGGITANEAKEEIPQKQVIDGALPQVRSVAGLEPRFSIGDRKLTLEKGPLEGSSTVLNTYYDSYHFLDETGEKVGELAIEPGKDKTLFVHWIGGKAGLWSNSFGPALIRDIKSQLKTIYPDYDYLTGFRVTGARDKAGATGLAKVRLAVDPEMSLQDYRRLQTIFAEAHDHAGIVNGWNWKSFGEGIFGDQP